MRTSALLAALLLASCRAETVPPAISVDDAWARATAPGQTSTAVYLTIANPGGVDRLGGVISAAGQASLHSSAVEGGIMRMRALDSLEIPAGSTVVLEPHGTHVMITGLKGPLAAGGTIRLELDFERSADRQIDVSVRPATEGAHR